MRFHSKTKILDGGAVTRLNKKRCPYTAHAKLCAMATRVLALTLGSLPTTSAQTFAIPDGERVSGCAFIMMMSTIICTVVIMRLVSGITNSICAMTTIRWGFKGTQRDAIDGVIGPQPTVTLWVAPASGQRYHLKKDCGKLLSAKHKKAILLVKNVAESK